MRSFANGLQYMAAVFTPHPSVSREGWKSGDGKGYREMAKGKGRTNLRWFVVVRHCLWLFVFCTVPLVCRCRSLFVVVRRQTGGKP